MMRKLWEKLRRIPLGGWVLIALALSAFGAGALKANSDPIRRTLLWLRPAQPGMERLAAGAQAILWRGEAVPQGFAIARNAGEARELRAEIMRAGKLEDARTFHRIDLAFMGGYGLLLFLGAWWAKKRARLLAESECGRARQVFAKAVSRLWPLAAVAAVLSVAGDLVEHFACLKMLAGNIHEEVLKRAAQAYAVKWFAVKTSFTLGLFAGLAASLMTHAVRDELRQIWELVMSAHRFAMKARFSVLIGALFTVALLTGPGEDIVRSVATGAFFSEAPMKSAPRPDFAHLGWFAVALLVLAGTCWGWARLVLAVRFTDAVPDDGDVEARLRRALPIYYGSTPLVAAASSFAIAPLQEIGATKFPIAQFFAASLAPLLLFFLLPLALVILRSSTTTSRKAMGPLSWTLLGYGVLAVVHALVNWTDLRVLGIVPVVLLVTALLVFGLGRPSAVLILPATLLAAAAMHGNFGEALPPALVLCGLGALAFWSADGVRGTDALHLPKQFPATDFFFMLFQKTARDDFEKKLRGDDRVGRALQRQQASAAPGKKPSISLTADAANGLRGLLRFCAVLAVVQLVLFAVVTWVRGFPFSIGSAAVLALGLAAWATAGSLLIFLTQATRFPILAASLVVAFLCSGVMDNHAIRLLGKPEPEFVQERVKQPPAPIGEAFDQWRTLAKKAGASEPPCIIIAAEGGGIRAALWPAIVLGTLQDMSLQRGPGRPDFASHVFAISGVSGGSVGAAVFGALCADGRDAGEMRERAAAICGKDHLAPAIGALLYPDFAQRFLPFAIFRDRASAFEGSWEDAWGDEKKFGRNRLAEPFSRLWKNDGARWQPALLLNATMVENGKRGIFSSLPILTGTGGQFIDAHDLHAHLRAFGPGAGDWQDVPLSTAAHASARFPLVSPPGRLPSGARVVDGGYFENSAATTALDVLNGVTKQLDHTGGTTRIIFIFLRYADGPGLTDLPPPNPRPPGPPIPAADPQLYAKKNVLNETGGIAGALLATREARGSYAQDAIFRRYLARENIEVRSFTFRGERIPLSWSLSQRSCDDMLSQFPADLNVPKKIMETDREIITSNVEVANWLLEQLYGIAKTSPGAGQ